MRERMDHNLFKPKTFEEGQHAAVGDCNGFTMQERWDAETPAFASRILDFCHKEAEILDYGCGPGRIAKEILKQNNTVWVTGTDASREMLRTARQYVSNDRFAIREPWQLDQQYDLIYLVYVLQHVPAIEIREVLQRIHAHLKDNGTFIFCSSLYRMAIRFDGQGFFDDRFLGVDLMAEIDRFFEFQGTLFSPDHYRQNPILEKMITGSGGGLPHPAYVLKKRAIPGALFNAGYGRQETKVKIDPEASQGQKTGTLEAGAKAKEEVIGGLQEKGQKEEINAKYPRHDSRSQCRDLILINRLAPGDILVMTNAIRDLNLAHPGKYRVQVRTPCNQIFDNNPYIVSFPCDEAKVQQIADRFGGKTGAQSDELIARLMVGDRSVEKHFVDYVDDTMVIDMHYPKIHTSGTCGWHFSYGHTAWLEEILGIKIPVRDIRPELYLSQNEKSWVSPAKLAGMEDPYWVINAGSKGDFTLKQYPYYQEAVDMLNLFAIEHGKPAIKLVQIGVKGHNHQPLSGVFDMVGKTDNIRDLFRLIYHAQGVITCVSFPMHIAAAFNKPCVVVAGAREGTRWELYPNQQFLYVNGCLPCAPYDGCWRSKMDDCNNKREGIPLCMKLIHPHDIVRAVERYYQGGMIEIPQELEVQA